LSTFQLEKRGKRECRESSRPEDLKALMTSRSFSETEGRDEVKTAMARGKGKNYSHLSDVKKKAKRTSSHRDEKCIEI